MGSSAWAKAHPIEDATKSRLYYARHRTERLVYARNYNEKNKQRRKELDAKRYRLNKEKTRAKNQAYKTPIGEACQKCGSTENLDRHHPDYNKPKETITLCRSCHATFHLGLSH